LDRDKAASAAAAAAAAAADAAAARLHSVEQQLRESEAAASSSQTALEQSEMQLRQALDKITLLLKQLQDMEAAAAAAAVEAASAARQSKAEHDVLEQKLLATDAQLSASLEQSSAAAAAAELTLKTLQAIHDSQVQSNAALQQDLNLTRQSLSASDAAAAAASSRVDSLQVELSSTLTLLADARARLEVESARVQELESKAAEAEGLRNELEESRAQITVAQKKNADSIRQLQRELHRHKSQPFGGGVEVGAVGSLNAGAELSPAHPASIKIAELDAQVLLLKEELERKKRMLSEIAEGGAGSGVMIRGAQATSSGIGSPAATHKEDGSHDKGVGSKLMSGFKKGGIAALTLGGLIPHKSSPKPDSAAHAIDQEKMNAMEAMLEETVMTNNKLQRELIKVRCNTFTLHSPMQSRPLSTHTVSFFNSWKMKFSNCALFSNRRHPQQQSSNVAAAARARRLSLEATFFQSKSREECQG
jgi:hypothetical protein